MKSSRVERRRRERSFCKTTLKINLNPIIKFQKSTEHSRTIFLDNMLFGVWRWRENLIQIYFLIANSNGRSVLAELILKSNRLLRLEKSSETLPNKHLVSCGMREIVFDDLWSAIWAFRVRFDAMKVVRTCVENRRVQYEWCMWRNEVLTIRFSNIQHVVV